MLHKAPITAPPTLFFIIIIISKEKNEERFPYLHYFPFNINNTLFSSGLLGSMRVTWNNPPTLVQPQEWGMKKIWNKVPPLQHPKRMDGIQET